MNGNYVKVPDEIVLNSSISVGARLLWCILMSYANPDGSRCFPGTTALGKDMGKDRKAIFRYLAELEGAQLIVRVSGRKTAGFSTNTYRFRAEHVCPQKGNAVRPQNGDTTNTHLPRGLKRRKTGLKTGLPFPEAP